MNPPANDACLICDRISAIRDGTNPYVVAESRSGFAVIGDHQFYRGYTLFLSKVHARELHELDPSVRKEFLEDMSEVAAATFSAFHPQKLNYELLGNKDVHLHWHLFPRHADDPMPEMPIWSYDKTIRNSDNVRPDEETLLTLRHDLANALRASKHFTLLV